jgi:hypothetical protein
VLKYIDDVRRVNCIETLLGIFLILGGKSIGKAIPLQTWTGLEGSRRVRLPDVQTIGT